jgi:hypothetical protein
MTSEKYTVEVIIDPESPTADIERAVLKVQVCRAKAAAAKAELAEAEDELDRMIPGRRRQLTINATAELSSDRELKKKITGRKPSGKNLDALKLINESGEVDHGKLARVFYDTDDRTARLKVYNRLRHWKNKGWLAQQDDDTWVVLSGLLSEETTTKK